VLVTGALGDYASSGKSSQVQETALLPLSATQQAAETRDTWWLFFLILKALKPQSAARIAVC
jgi:hypothetical protein